MKKAWKKYLVNIAVGVAAAAVAVTGSLIYKKKVDDIALNEKTQYLRQISSQGTALVMSKLTNGKLAVDSVAKYIEGTKEDIFSPSAIAGIHSVAVTNNFDNISIVDKEGNLYHSMNDIPINVSDRYYFSDFLVGETVVSDVVDARDDGNSVIVVGAPIKRDGGVIGGVIARYPAKSISAMLEKNLSGDNVQCYVCHSDGEVFGCAKINPAEKPMTNILLDLQQADRSNEAIILRMKSDMKNDKQGFAKVMHLDRMYLINYEAIGINDLFCVVMMPMDVAITDIQNTAVTVIWLCMIGWVALISFFSYVMIVTKKRRGEYEKINGELGVIYESVPVGMFRCSCDSSLKVSFANEYFYSLLNMSEKEFADTYDKSLGQLLAGGADNIIDNIALGNVFSVEKQIKGDLDNRCICVKGRAVKNKNSGEVELFCALTDETRQHTMNDELHMHEQRCNLILEQINDIVFEWNYDKNEMFYSKHFNEKFGYAPVVNDFPDGFIHLGIIYRDDRQVFRNMFKTINMGSSYSEDEMRIRKNDGGYLWCKMCIMAVRDEKNQLHRIIGMLEDIDAEKREGDEIKGKSVRDELTGLYSKNASQALISECLDNANCGTSAFMMIDIDNFKEFNEILGEKVGDEALKEISKRIQNLFRDGDIIGRVGGDKFVVFMRNITSRDIADYKAKCIVQMMDYNASDGNNSAKITGSIGIAFAPDDASTYAQLYSKADKALYFSKKNGKAQVSTYDSTL